MKRKLKFRCLLCLIALISVSLWADPVVYVNFEHEEIGKESAYFKAVRGSWILVDTKRYATRNRVLCNTSSYNEERSSFYSVLNKLFSMNKPYRINYTVLKSNSVSLARFTGINRYSEGYLSVQFNLMKGTFRRTAGIVFNMKKDSFMAISVDSIERSMELLHFNKRRKKLLKRVEDLPLNSRRWHTLRVVTKGKTVHGYLDNRFYLAHDLDNIIDGTVGLMSLGDSKIYYDDFSITLFDEEKKED